MSVLRKVLRLAIDLVKWFQRRCVRAVISRLHWGHAIDRGRKFCRIWLLAGREYLETVLGGDNYS